MSWFHVRTTAGDARNHASAAEIMACFRDQRNLLDRLAFLITADEAIAQQAVAQACEITLQGNSPFPNWLLEWAKAATIAGAIFSRGMRFACVKGCTKIDNVRMSSTYASSMMNGGRLVSLSFFRWTPRNS